MASKYSVMLHTDELHTNANILPSIHMTRDYYYILTESNELVCAAAMVTPATNSVR